MRALILALLLLAAPAGAQGLKGIKGADDRVAVEPGQYPWSAVGRINNGQGGHCSGVLIGPRLAVTAAHCLYNRRTRQANPPHVLHFVAGYARGEYIATAQVESYQIAPNWRFDAPYDAAASSTDWALLVLKENLGEQVGWLGIAPAPVPGARIVTVGYGQDKAHVPMADLACRISGRFPEGVLTHDCDAVHGDSGAPVMVWKDGAPWLAAIHVSTFTMADGTTKGGAVGSDAFLAAAAKLGAATAGKPGAASAPLDAAVKARAEGR